ncbi:MAG: aldolase [Bacteroidetes bacterium]|nr:MAG: aldolase [Bacteroidota bacterium]
MILLKGNEDKATIYGPFLKLTDPAIVEICAHAGFDFCIIDMEHGPIGHEQAQNLIRAAEVHDLFPVIRVTENSETQILKALDIGAKGIQVPHINNKSDAEKAVNAAKFNPLGNRGLCRYVRSANYSSRKKENYFSEANNETSIILQIEGLEGISNLAEILKVDHIDIIFIGPYDLSQSLGVPGDVHNQKVLEQMEKVVIEATRQGVEVGTFVEAPEDAKKWVDVGVKYISYSVDVGIFYKACENIVKNLNQK